MAERIFLNVPFAEKDEAKRLGARWDPDAQRWWADPSKCRLDELRRWLPRDESSLPRAPAATSAPLPPPQGPRQPAVRLTLLGLPTRCWKCHNMTTALVGLLPADGDAYDMLDCSDPDVLAIAAGLLDSAFSERHHIGVVKRRYSRTVGHEYLSNGCVHCDALLGAFPLREEAIEILGDRGVAGFSRLGSVDVPIAVFDRLLAARHGDLGDDASDW